MSVVRFSDESDVYVYFGWDSIVCCGCKLDPMSHHEQSTAAMVAHLEDHRKAGHKVPAWAIGDLQRR